MESSLTDTEPRTPMIRLRLLGSFSLSLDGRPVRLPARAQRLVALLALRGRVGRRRLADTLWSDVVDDRALASLRTCIWRVNQAALGLVETVGADVGLGLNPDVDVDRLVVCARSVPDPTQVTEAIEAALDAGELLPDWDDIWLAEERERLHQVRLHLLESGASLLAGTGRFGLAMEAALAALRVDELRESAHRTVIAVHLAEGNVAEARRAYASCRRTLHEALGVEPTPATATLVAV